jgi:hypothetical protein
MTAEMQLNRKRLFRVEYEIRVHFGALNESCAKVQILAHDLLQI